MEPELELPAESEPGMPRWVKVLGIAVLAVIILAVVLMSVIGGDHGPGRHSSAPALTDLSRLVT